MKASEIDRISKRDEAHGDLRLKEQQGIIGTSIVRIGDPWAFNVKIKLPVVRYYLNVICISSQAVILHFGIVKVGFPCLLFATSTSYSQYHFERSAMAD